jgi:3-hydroxyisobutyrate dehydrogenase-like beta-hydroxyacid dehydrogenase
MTTRTPTQIGMVGLGRMGANLAHPLDGYTGRVSDSGEGY